MPAPRLRVLVVDDSQDAADSLVMLLAMWGHEARAAYDGDAGLRAALDWRPHVAFVDIRLPGRDGHEVAGAVRAAGGAPRPLLVALTGLAADFEARRASTCGFDLCLSKPVDLDQVQRLLARADARRLGVG